MILKRFPFNNKIHNQLNCLKMFSGRFDEFLDLRYRNHLKTTETIQKVLYAQLNTMK
jgi:hypothetical protein